MEVLEKIIRERRNEINSYNNNYCEDFLQQFFVVDSDGFVLFFDYFIKLIDVEIKDNILIMIIVGFIYLFQYLLFLDKFRDKK